MPTMLRLKVAPPVIHKAGMVAAVEASQCVEKNADTREPVGERSRGAASLPEAAVDGNSMEVIELDDDDDEDENENSSSNPLHSISISDSMNNINSSSSSSYEQEGGNEDTATDQPTPTPPLRNMLEDPTCDNNIICGTMAELAPHHPPATNSDVDKHDEAFSIDELEYIRSRLFQLLDRVNKSMMEKVLQHESLTQFSIGRLRSKNIDELSMNELMDKLSQDSNTLTTSSFGKRSHCDGLESAEMGNKRQCRPCPVCHETTAESSLSASVGSCEICEVNGLCQRCYSSCPSCQRTTCADCLLSCADCGTRHQCSDCAVLLEGKCIICREKPKTVHQCVNGNGDDGASRRELAPTDNVNMNVQQTSTYSNKLVCIPHRSQTSLQLPQSCLTGPAPLIHYLPPSAPAPSHPQNYVAPLVHQQKELLPTIHDIQTKPTPMASELLSIHGFHKSQKPAPVVHQQKVSLPTTSDIQTKSTPTTSELFSIHRFLISEEGMIGINVSTLYPNRRCIVSNVIPNSVAFYLGVEVNDEIIVPTSTTFEYSNIYDLFLNAIKHRPLLFEVKRAYKSNEVPETLTLDGPHCLHRFTITEPGSLGITIIDHGSTATIVSRVVPNSLGDIYGLCVNDIICEPFESVLSYAKSGKRPWILEVWRAVPTTTDSDGLERLHVQAGCSVDNPFIFSFPIGNTVSKDHSNRYNRDEVEGNTGQAGSYCTRR